MIDPSNYGFLLEQRSYSMAAQLDRPIGKIEQPPLGEFSPDIMTRLHSKELDWQRLTGGPRFDYLIDYLVAVTRVDREAGLIEFLAKWEPNAYCHFHRHLGRTATLNLECEYHIVE